MSPAGKRGRVNSKVKDMVSPEVVNEEDERVELGDVREEGMGDEGSRVE